MGRASRRFREILCGAQNSLDRPPVVNYIGFVLQRSKRVSATTSTVGRPFDGDSPPGEKMHGK
jgi:hypothetical protein